jgi:hypothetical protein
VLDGLAAGTVDIVVGTHALLAKSVGGRTSGSSSSTRSSGSGSPRRSGSSSCGPRWTCCRCRRPRSRARSRWRSRASGPVGDRDPARGPPAGADRRAASTTRRQVALAIRRELLRDGQVFYVHNHVESIHRIAAGMQEMVPDARVEVAHGQMDERQLERIMVRFWEREIDVLVCTTIIESGLDIPNANTLIIERADLLGLSQLHQLRGRVGRSSERGYAYFLFPRAPRSPSPPTSGSRPSPSTPGSARGSRSPCATSRSAGPATSSGPSSPARSPRSGSRCTRSCSRRRSPTSPARPSRRSTSSSSCPSTPTCRTTTSRTSGSGSSCTSGSRRSATRRGSRTSRPSSRPVRALPDPPNGC